jgi:hypothetical protein
MLASFFAFSARAIHFSRLGQLNDPEINLAHTPWIEKSGSKHVRDGF